MNDNEITMNKANGILNIEVKVPTVIAGQLSMINLLIRNPFSVPVTIESIQAPTSSLLMNTDNHKVNYKNMPARSQTRAGKLLAMIDSFRIKEISVGPLKAHFPDQAGRTINVKMKPQSKLIFNSHLFQNDTLNITNAVEAEVNITIPEENGQDIKKAKMADERIIQGHQEYIASFEIKTSEWLMAKPKSLDLYALIRYRVEEESRSQVIPVNINIQPPVKSIVLGCTFGGLLGFLAKQLNSGVLLTGEISMWGMIVSFIGIIVMSTISAIIMSRSEVSKGFITLEDFYGAFVVGVLIGYFGTQYFDKILKVASKTGT